MNRYWTLSDRPVGGWPDEGTFELREGPIPTPGPGQALTRTIYVSLDPYQWGYKRRRSEPAGAPCHARTVAQVIESRMDGYAPGDLVFNTNGWSEYGLMGEGVARPAYMIPRKLDPAKGRISQAVGVLGMLGLTAYSGMVLQCGVKAGETAVVSAASGGVGQIAGQLARLRGARVVGIAGGPDKCRSVVEELGFDECIDYRQFPDLKAMSGALKAACPSGIDGYFENVGGLLLDAVMLRANAFARIAMCGMIAGYNGEPIPMTLPQLILTNRMKIEGFIVSEHMEAWPEALKELGTMVATGKLKYRETVAQGLENAPEAFFGLLKGKNQGKQLVKL